MSKPIKINLKTKSQIDKKVIITGIFILLLVSLLGAGMGFYYSKALNELRVQEAMNQRLKSQQVEYVNQQKNLEKKLELENKLKTKAQHVEELSQKSPLLSKAFSGIEKAVTPDTQLLKLEITGDRVLISGMTSNFTEVAKMLTALEESEIFSNTGLISTQETVDNLVVFEIETVWEAKADGVE